MNSSTDSEAPDAGESQKSSPKNPVISSVERLLERQLAASSAARARLEKLQGKTLALEFTGIGLNIYVLCHPDKLELQTQYTQDADVIITGSPIAMLSFARSQDQDGMRSGSVRFTGDVGVAMDFQKLFSVLSPDVDEELSRLIGDEAAHRVGTAVRDFFSWSKSALQRTGDNLSEYITDTRKDTPTNGELEKYLEDVDRVRADVDRAEARFERLIKRHVEPR